MFFLPAAPHKFSPQLKRSFSREQTVVGRSTHSFQPPCAHKRCVPIEKLYYLQIATPKSQNSFSALNFEKKHTPKYKIAQKSRNIFAIKKIISFVDDDLMKLAACLERR